MLETFIKYCIDQKNWLIVGVLFFAAPLLVSTLFWYFDVSVHDLPFLVGFVLTFLSFAMCVGGIILIGLRIFLLVQRLK